MTDEDDDDAATPPAVDPAARSFASMLHISGSSVDAGKYLPRARRTPRRVGQTDQSPRRRRWSGAGPSARDPQALGSVFSRVAQVHGWGEDMQRGRIFGQWDLIVGEMLAEKTTPVSLEAGVLTIRAVSTAWATQLRLELRRLHLKINESVGPDVVTSIRVQGPVAPSWKKGRRSMRGRGPRDTYG
ncbi:uncharacterized protein DUF721 [Antricoccus suffuscus]|uniref:Uncharacterized protein DUF721 n=1 Tax=Antricoccus suffuscus TaxID=1629062 RepID=A0A2T1A255_9ACTN|nr:DciA family protein [Antricoccus suffuscus]PRZ42690.1 uncharacterized protein DUF721 [Antricoccus suffuscus]